MRERCAEQGHHSVARVLIDRAFKAMHLRRDTLEAAVDDVVYYLGIELLSECGEAGHVGKQDRDLLTLTFQRATRRENLLDQVSRCIGEWRTALYTGWRWSRRWKRCEVPTPDQHGTVLIDGKLACLDDFRLQILKVRIIKPKLPLESPIRDPLMTLEEFEYPIEHCIEVHTQSLTPLGW
jgi:hypothetical protein